MFSISTTNRFERDLKLIKKRSDKDFKLIADFIFLLIEAGAQGLSRKYKAHKLKGEYVNCWE